ncbi:VRR-NUC endonuclease domain-containing protein [Rhizobium phage RHph_X3_2]|nr:VRR-NUC endonuclease domain-containing protein [Rhizobium phage RHph_X3_2]
MITPEQLAASGSEHGHQVAFFQWAATISTIPHMDMLYAVPNGGERNLKVASNMKAEGVKSGVPDVVWPVPRGMFAGLYLELKKPTVVGHANGGRSDKQVEWHKKLIAQRYAVATVYGWQAMAATVVSYWQSEVDTFWRAWVRRGDDSDCLFVVERSKKSGVSVLIAEEFAAW